MRAFIKKTQESAIGILVLAALLTCGMAQASDYPNKSIRLVVPYTPGGPADSIARTVAEPLAIKLKQAVVVENKPGASGGIGAAFVASAAPDGYTLLLSNISDAVAVALGVKLTYDFQKDLTPIILLGDTPFVLIAGSGIKVSSVKELIEFCKNNPGKVNFGSSGTGSASQLAGELFVSMAGCSATHVPYKGQADATMALMGGQLTFAFANPVPALPQIKSGALRALAVSSKTSYRSLPDVPTVNQDGLAGFDVSPWFGLVTPAKTPPVVIARLQNELTEILTRPDIQEKLFRLGVQAKGGSSADFASLIASDIVRWKKVAQDANIKVE